jgi:adenylate kinase
MLKTRDEQIDAVLVLDVPNEELIGRLSGRRVCLKCGRPFHIDFNPPEKNPDCPEGGEHEIIQRKDDSEDSVRNRLEVYEKQTSPLIEYYEGGGKSHRIDGTGAMNDVFGRIKEALGKVSQS